MTTWMDDYAPPPYWPGRTCEHCKHWGERRWQPQWLGDTGVRECQAIEGFVEGEGATCDGNVDASSLYTEPNFSCCLWEPRR